MKIDIPYYIRQVVGSFSIIQTPASFSQGKSKIHPPFLSLEFSEQADGDSALAKYISDTGLFSSKKIDKAISAFSTSVFDQLTSQGRFEVDQIGALTKNGSSITYSPTLRAMTDEFKGLSSIPLVPIKHIQESNAVDHAVNTDDIKTRPEESSPIWHPILAGLLIALAFIAFKKGCYDQKVADEASIEQSIDESENSSQLAASEDDSLKRVIDSKYEEVDQMIGDGATTIPKKIDEELANLDEVDIKGSTEADPVSENAIETEEAADPDISNDESSGAELQSDEIVDNTEVEDKPLSGAAKFASIIPSNGKCIIILGSFSKASNTTRMISKVQRANLPLYTSQYKGYTRVGFEVECTGVDLDEYLTEVRRKFASKAWYLDPSVDIPYR